MALGKVGTADSITERLETGYVSANGTRNVGFSRSEVRVGSREETFNLVDSTALGRCWGTGKREESLLAAALLVQ